MYYLCVAALFLMVAIVRGLRHSRSGRVLIAVRENARAAQSFGVNATVAKLTAFAVSGFIAAFAGAVFVHHQQQLGISAYTVAQSREAFTMIVIGGLGSVPGAFLGAFIIKGIGYFQSVFPSPIRPYLTFFTTGVGLLFVLLVVPGGFSQIFYNMRDRLLRVVADRRDVIVPSLFADMAPGTTPDELAPGAAPPATVDVESSLEHAATALPEESDELVATADDEADDQGDADAATDVDDTRRDAGDRGGVATLPRRGRRRSGQGRGTGGGQQ